MVTWCIRNDYTHTCVFALILTWPNTGALGGLPSGFSTLRLANASSPKILRAYKLAARNPHSPVSAWKNRYTWLMIVHPHKITVLTFSGVRHFMFVLPRRWCKYSWRSVMLVFTVIWINHTLHHQGSHEWDNNRYLILPFKFSPHFAELNLRT